MEPDRDKLYRDSNKAAMEYAKNAIQFIFLLNGASATALFSKTDRVFIFPASLFALGAFLAVLCVGLTYIVQMFICETWRQDVEPYKMFILGKWRDVSIAQIEWSRTIAIALWLMSAVLFIVGLICAANVSAT